MNRTHWIQTSLSVIGNEFRRCRVINTEHRESIQEHGFIASGGWESGPGVYVTSNPDSWLFLFEHAGGMNGIYSRSPSGNPTTATLGEDFVVRCEVIPPSRIRLERTVAL